MPTITKRGDSQWQAKVRLKGCPTVSKTFLYRDDAEKWARVVERTIETVGFIDRKEAERNTFGDLLGRYQREVTPHKKGQDSETQRINGILRDPILPGIAMSALSSADIAAFRDRRLKAVKGSTVNRDLKTISAAINHARREWRIHVENPVELVKRPSEGPSRDRRLDPEEEQYLFAAFEEEPRHENGTLGSGTRNPYIGPAVRLAIESAMRRGELLKMDWKTTHLKKQTTLLADTKNGDSRVVPLSKRAVAELEALPKPHQGAVFKLSAVALYAGFRRAVQRARVKYLDDCAAQAREPNPDFLRDLRFHDTRHEATSRLAEKFNNILELSAVTGHKDLYMLKRYYHPRAEDLAKKMG